MDYVKAKCPHDSMIKLVYKKRMLIRKKEITFYSWYSVKNPIFFWYKTGRTIRILGIEYKLRDIWIINSRVTERLNNRALSVIKKMHFK